MTVTYGSSSLQWVGAALEETYGEGEANPTIWFPSDTPVYKPNPDIFVDAALRGTMAPQAAQVQGLRSDTLTYKSYFYVDTSYFMVRAALGLPDVVTGTAAPYTHTTSVQSGNNGQPAGTCLWYYDAQGKSWKMPGAIIDSLKITIDVTGLGTFEVTWMGLPASPVDPPTNTPSLVQPMPSWNTTATIGDVVSTNRSGFEWDIARSAFRVDAINGTQVPAAIGAGAAIITGSITAIYQGSEDTDLQALLTNGQPAMILQCNPAGDDVHSLTFQTSVVAYDAVDITDNGGKYMQIKSTVKALTNATDVAGGGNLSNMLVTLVSAASGAI